MSARMCLSNHTRPRALSKTCSPTPRSHEDHEPYFCLNSVFVRTPMYIYKSKYKVFHVEHFVRTPEQLTGLTYASTSSTSSSAALRRGFISGRVEIRRRLTSSPRLLSINRRVRRWPGDRS